MESDEPVDSGRLDHLITVISGNTESLAELKSETAAENVKRDQRIKWSRLASLIAGVVGVVGITVGGIGVVSAERANDAARKVELVIEQNAKDVLVRRTAFCQSLDDVGTAIKAGSSGAITTLFDPAFQGPNSDPALLQKFADSFAANGAVAVDEAISNTKARNGFPDDCNIGAN